MIKSHSLDWSKYIKEMYHSKEEIKNLPIKQCNSIRVQSNSSAKRLDLKGQSRTNSLLTTAKTQKIVGVDHRSQSRERYCFQHYSS